MLVLEGLVGLHRTIQLQLLEHYWSEHQFSPIQSLSHVRLFVYCDGYSISSKGFLPTVEDIMAIQVKFTHSSLF